MDSTRLTDWSLRGERAFGKQDSRHNSFPGAGTRPKIAFLATADASRTGHGLVVVHPNPRSAPQRIAGRFLGAPTKWRFLHASILDHQPHLGTPHPRHARAAIIFIA